MPRFALTALLAAASLAMAAATAGHAPADADADAGNDRDLQQQRGRDLPAELQEQLDTHHGNQPHYNAKIASSNLLNDLIRTEECHPGWGVGCQDNPLYKTRMGLDCSMHVVVHCEDMTKIGFTEADMEELILNCPCSCNIEW